MHLKYDHRTTLLGLMSIVHLQFLEEKNRTCFISSCTCIAILQLCLRKVAINYTVNIMILFHGYVFLAITTEILPLETWNAWVYR